MMFGCIHTSLYRVGSGGWSSDGIQVISNTTRRNVTTVLCNSTHLTSFAVLVDVAGGLEVPLVNCQLPNVLAILATRMLHTACRRSSRILAAFTNIITGYFRGRKTGTPNCLLHWLHHINHLSLHHCRLLPGYGVSNTYMSSRLGLLVVLRFSTERSFLWLFIISFTLIWPYLYCWDMWSSCLGLNWATVPE